MDWRGVRERTREGEGKERRRPWLLHSIKKERFGNKRGLLKLPPPHFPEEIASPPILEMKCWGSQLLYQSPRLSPPQARGSRGSSPLLYIVISPSLQDHTLVLKIFFWFKPLLIPLPHPATTISFPHYSRTPSRGKQKDLNKDLYTNVQGSITHNSSKLGSI